MRKHIKSLVPFLLCLSLFVSLFVPCAGATDTTPTPQDEHSARQPDYTRKGSVTVDIHLSDGTKVPGGSLTAYLVAKAREDDGNNDFVYVEPFGKAGEIVDADTINNAEAGAPNMAAELEEKAGAGGKTVSVGSNGRAVFTGLELGLYLIVQDKPAAGYEPIRSFLVTVPMWDGEKLVYDVNASPKADVAHKKAEFKLTAEKIVKIDSGTPSSKEQFEFRVTPYPKTAPMPVNSKATVDEKTGAMTVKNGAGNFSFGTITFGMDDVGKKYRYVIREIPGKNSNYTYDTHQYLVTIVVTGVKDGVIQYTVSIVRSDNKTVSKISFENHYKPGTPGIPVIPHRPSRYYWLPQTGQRWWPVYLLAGLGLGLFLIGWRLRRKGSENP